MPNYRIHKASLSAGSIEIQNGARTVFKCVIYELPVCCGIREIGNIRLSVLFDDDKEELKTKIDEAVEQLMRSARSTTSNRCIVLIANLIKTEACALLAESFERTKTFTKIKTFVNDNSGNTIDVWISNN